MTVKTIDFSEYKVDEFQKAEDHRLSVFKQACVIAGILTAQVKQIQDFMDMFIDVLEGRTINGGEGAQLDVLGRIVGQARLLVNAQPINWLKPDPVTGPTIYQRGAPDTSYAWTTNAPTTGSVVATDGQYRVLIESKIVKNQVKTCSVPEIQKYIKAIYGIESSVRTVGPLQVEIDVPSGTPSYIVTNLGSNITDARADNQYFVPISTGVRINAVNILP